MEVSASANLVLLRRAFDETDRLIDAIGPEQWTATTACEEMDVLGVVRHLVGGLDQFAVVGAGGELDMTAEAVFEATLAEPEYERAASGFMEIWSAPGVAERSYAMPWGDSPGLMLIGFMLIESVTHGWDLARATNQQRSYPDEIVAATLAIARAADDPSIRVPGMFGPIVAVPETAPLIDQLAGFLGRHP